GKRTYVRTSGYSCQVIRGTFSVRRLELIEHREAAHVGVCGARRCDRLLRPCCYLGVRAGRSCRTRSTRSSRSQGLTNQAMAPIRMAKSIATESDVAESTRI